MESNTCIICHEEGASCRYYKCKCTQPRYHLNCKLRSMAADVKNTRPFRCGVCRTSIDTFSYETVHRCVDEVEQYHDAIECVCDLFETAKEAKYGLVSLYPMAVFAIINYATIRNIVSTRQQTRRVFDSMMSMIQIFVEMLEGACLAANIKCSGTHDHKSSCNVRFQCASILSMFELYDTLQLDRMKHMISKADHYDDLYNILFMLTKIVMKELSDGKRLLFLSMVQHPSS